MLTLLSKTSFKATKEGAMVKQPMSARNTNLFAGLSVRDDLKDSISNVCSLKAPGDEHEANPPENHSNLQTRPTEHLGSPLAPRPPLRPMLYHISGCGGSGKTTKALTKGAKYETQSYKVLYVVSKFKTSACCIVTRPQNMRKEALSVERLCEIDESSIDQHHVIVIDEGWMIFDLNLCEDWVHQKGKVVIISSITKDYQGRTFLEMALVSSRATKRKELKAKCARCGSDSAHYDHRITEESELLVEDINKYESLCGPCFYAASKDKYLGSKGCFVSNKEIFCSQQA